MRRDARTAVTPSDPSSPDDSLRAIAALLARQAAREHLAQADQATPTPSPNKLSKETKP